MSEHAPDSEEIAAADAQVAAASEVTRERYEAAVGQLPEAARVVTALDPGVRDGVVLGARLFCTELARHHREFLAEISRELVEGRHGKLTARERKILDRYNLGVLALGHMVSALGEGP